ncbi:hypothetical protein H6F43_03120 [Leptolyngbya sp. FACHB-36]|uniref:hypothetical protein n=1 Tax=Leptolyngbya sp. FACHB-36 TaxID=2692808 RepID=UPI00168079EA|nr:hypothetical protein [Leptolyngbya sp. FACHB-36]MBD2019175.1 hypothetical protein [Leptolyngbya sp. FACHB-36]
MTEDELTRQFASKAPTEAQRKIDAAALEFAKIVLANVKDTRLQQKAINSIQQARTLANQVSSIHPSQQIEAEVEKRRPK